MSDKTSKVSLSDIPVLKNNANYTAWRQAVEAQLLLAGAIGIIDGSDKEPYRGTPGQSVSGRTERAGSARPSAPESTTKGELTKDEKLEWSKWQKNEEKVQGVIRATVSKGILVDLLDMSSAKAMWDFIEEIHKQDTPEEQAAVRDALATLRLGENASADQMETHLEDFNVLLLRAMTAKLAITQDDRVQRFLATLPRSLNTLRQQFRMCDIEKRTWREVLKQYNLEIADIRRLEGPKKEEGKAMYVKDQRQKKNVNGNQNRDSTRPKRDSQKGECFRCHKPRHFMKDCPRTRERRAMEKVADEDRKGKASRTTGKNHHVSKRTMMTMAMQW
jgi:hypothetical protein